MQPSNSSPIWSSVAVHGTFLTKSVHWLLLSVTNTSFWHTQHSTANIEYVFDILNLSLTSVSHWDYLGNGRRQTHTYDGWLRECRTCSIKWHHYQRPCLMEVISATNTHRAQLTAVASPTAIKGAMRLSCLQLVRRGSGLGNGPTDQKQEVKVIWQKAPHGGPIPRLGVTPGGRNLYHWIPGAGFPISVP